MISQMLLNKIISTKIARIHLFLKRGSCCVDTYLFAYYLHVFEETLMVTCSCAVLEGGRENIMPITEYVSREPMERNWGKLSYQFGCRFKLYILHCMDYPVININVLIDNTTAVNKIVKRFCFIMFQLQHQNLKQKV